MKNRILFSLLIPVVLLVTCADPLPTFEEKLDTALCDYFSVDSVSNVQVIDTVFVENLDSAQVLYEESNVLMQISKDESQIKLDTARVQLEKSKLAMDDASYKLLLPFWEQNILDWENVIKIETENLNFTDSMITVGVEELEFIELARDGIEGKKAFYVVETKVNNELKKVAVSAKFTVIREFE